MTLAASLPPTRSRRCSALRRSGLTRVTVMAVVCLAFGAARALAQAPADFEEPAVLLASIRVEAETLRDDRVQAPFLPAAQGPRIYAGKKSLVVDFDAMPQIQTDNYRQAFAKTPGLLTSELSNASLLSLSYRGIGDPHESQNLLVLKDGVPFVLDPFGYPTVYYAPPFESVDRLEFIAGGAALLHGPQPGGVLNYVSHTPDRRFPASLTTQHVFGSHSLYSTFSTLEGGFSRGGYQATFDHRSGDSFRTRNSDFELNGATARVVLDAGTQARWVLDLDVYDADSGEPGGLTRATGPGRLTYATDRNQTQLQHDRVRVNRRAAVLSYEREQSDAALTARAWASRFSRFSKRENGSGFGTIPTGNTIVGSGPNALMFADSNTLNLHKYYTLAAEVRARRDGEAFGAQSTTTGGVTAMHIESPIANWIGATRDAETGFRVFKAERESRYLALFAEQALRWDRLTLTPGVRLDFLRQEITETQNLSKTVRPTPTPLGRQQDDQLEPLFGLGATYALARATELYANVSSAYKPKTYGDAIPTGGTDTVSGDLEAAHALNYEVGYRGRPAQGATFDVSAFVVDYRNRFGRVGSSIRNVGRSRNVGLSAATEVDLLQLAGGDGRRGLSWYGNVQLLDAEFVAGPLDGRTPQYAPEVMFRTGLVYRVPGRVKLAFLVTHLDRHFADDANTRTPTADWLIPAYTVADFTAEVYAWRGALAGRPAALAVLAGVNNVFDEDYTSRIRSNGIDPAAPRNAYLGVRLEL